MEVEVAMSISDQRESLGRSLALVPSPFLRLAEQASMYGEIYPRNPAAYRQERLAKVRGAVQATLERCGGVEQSIVVAECDGVRGGNPDHALLFLL